VHEKNVRHGHISTLLSAGASPVSRLPSALLATLLPDPGNRRIAKSCWIDRGDVTEKTVTEKDDDGNAVSELKKTVQGGVLAWGEEETPLRWMNCGSQIRDFYGALGAEGARSFLGRRSDSV